MAQSTAAQMRSWTGSALFSFGFRPFFLFAGAWAAFSMVLWILMLSTAFTLPTRLDPVAWHAHAFLFSYLGAVLAGFLLTAIPNWTGRLPMVGWRLAGLFALWALGRIAIASSALMPGWVSAGLDVAFPLVLGGLILREIVAGQNWRNLIVLAMLAVFILANVLFHIAAISGGDAARGVGLRLGLATAVMMISVIGGRIIPSFTHNWLVQQGHLVRPSPPMRQFDKLTLILSIPILTTWVLAPDALITGGLLLLFGLLHSARLLRWKGHHTVKEPLVCVLHAAYAFLPLGAFALAYNAIVGGALQAAAQHVWMAGAIGAMTLAVMTRATLGHTGQPLSATVATVALYLCLFASVVLRLFALPFPALLTISGALWITAFGIFTLSYAPLLLSHRPAAPP